MATKGKNFKGKTFGRRKCYNCDSPKHFVAVPYERREDKYEKLVFKKKSFNKFAKRRGDKALIHEEYLSGDDEDGDDENKGMAAIAVHSKSSSSSSSSLFESPNENKPNSHRCLMAKEVISKSTIPKPSSPTPNSSNELEDACEDDGVDYSEEASLAFMKTLKGESLARFLNIMKSLTERDDYIDNVETLLIEENERNDLLEQNLHEVETMKSSLEETITSHEIDFVKVNDALEL